MLLTGILLFVMMYLAMGLIMTLYFIVSCIKLAQISKEKKNELISYVMIFLLLWPYSMFEVFVNGLLRDIVDGMDLEDE